MIVVGYQGIGKSTASHMSGEFVDLESGSFWVDGNRDANWARIYINIAEHLHAQGYIVLVSSHESVRNTLLSDIAEGVIPKSSVYCIFPDKSLRREWISKLELRYNSSQLEKDKKAYLNAVDRFEENIEEIANCGLYNYRITSNSYNLCDILRYLRGISASNCGSIYWR